MTRRTTHRGTREAGARKTDPLAKFVNETALAKLAGDKSYARGVAYWRQGAVLDLMRVGDGLKARVMGSEEYRVALRAAGRTLEWSCTCPLGAGGEFCKHAVATGLAWLDGGGSPDDEPTLLRSHLASQSKEELIDLLLEQASEDPELRARLESASLRHAAPSEPKALKEVVRRAFTVHGFVDYRGMRTLVTRVESVVHLLREQIAAGNAREALELADYALRRGLVVYGQTDDSDGGFGELLHDIADLHLEAFQTARPAGDAQGAALFELQMVDQWDLIAIADYAPLLDKKGLARYRALVEKAWSAVPERLPGARRETDDRSFRVTCLMEALARLDGDVDALIAVKRRDLSSPYTYLQIAEMLSAAKRQDEALAWAERGHSTFATNPDSRLVAFLISAYRQTRRNDDATALAWEHFVRSPNLDTYKLLRSACGTKEWASLRDKALTHLRAESRQTARQAHGWPGGNSLLVEILLHDGDSDTALAEAREGGCNEWLWRQLAEVREASHPAEAAEIHRARIDKIIGRTNNAAYDEAAKLTGHIRHLMMRAGMEKECGEWLNALRARHQAKRNFMKRLEEARLA